MRIEDKATSDTASLESGSIIIWREWLAKEPSIWAQSMYSVRLYDQQERSSLLNHFESDYTNDLVADMTY